MFQKYILPLLAAFGVAVGIYAAMLSSTVVPPTPPVADPPQAPYGSFVAGAGLVEANTENIAIGTQIAGIVSKLWVAIGSRVKQGDPLFTIDERATRATLNTLQAAIDVATAQLASATNELTLAESIPDKRALSVEVVNQRRYAVQIAKAQLAQARAQRDATVTDLERLTVRAPVDGTVLQLKVHPGEFAPAGVLQTPLLVFGNVEPLNVRVDVNENDAWRVNPKAQAAAYLRGNRAIHSTLKFVRFEPNVIPKVSLTGAPTERIDTRVLQVIYHLEDGILPIFVGQQMDIYIQAVGQNVTPITSQAKP